MSFEIIGSGNHSRMKLVPCHPGYAMGGIISQAELEGPFLSQQKDEIKMQIAKIDELKENVHLAFKNKTPDSNLIKEQAQSRINAYFREKKALIERLKCVESRIEKLKKEKVAPSYVQPLFPIDFDRSSLKYKNLSSEMENMHYLLIKEKNGVRSRLNEFALHLSKMHYFPPIFKLVDQISSSIINMVKQESEVTVIGSFILLGRVRRIDPVIVRKGAILDKEIRESYKKYSVITEAVLGGVFIGFGTRVSANKEQESSTTGATSLKSERSLFTNLNVFSFVSQGAIPPSKNFNLWEIYNNWKRRLIEDEECGFPVAYKVRSLEDILIENRQYRMT